MESFGRWSDEPPTSGHASMAAAAEAGGGEKDPFRSGAATGAGTAPLSSTSRFADAEMRPDEHLLLNGVHHSLHTFSLRSGTLSIGTLPKLPCPIRLPYCGRSDDHSTETEGKIDCNFGGERRLG